ncbi:diphosphate--fructose-6-phosphate 1-phosphotransferase, partial [bacterium]|nr:diphosphate--fructose-6-phosphate 1-phosphotransferase [bacterium]
IEGLRKTPSSALGSSRHKLQEKDLAAVLKILKKYNIRYMFLIGGNDTADTIHRVEKYCKERGYELIGIGIPKTVDNDLFGTDHTPGYPSSARYVALSVKQGGVLARDMQKVDQIVIYQAVGRDSGWLAASAVLGKKREEDPPHLIYIPERPFKNDKFLADVERCHKKYGWVSISIGEGISYADGTPVTESSTTDKFKNIEFGAMGGVSSAMVLHRMACNEFGFRGEFQVVESLQMCGGDRMSEVDVDESYRLGVEAVRKGVQGETGVMVTLERDDSPEYHCSIGTIGLEKVALAAKKMPDEFIDASGSMVTQAFTDYAKPFVGELPEYTSLDFHKAGL